MTRAISRDSLDELAHHLGVNLQQGPLILDADGNEGRDSALPLLRRLVHDSLGEGSPNGGFRIVAPYVSLLLPPQRVLVPVGGTDAADDGARHQDFGPLPFFMQFPGDVLDDFSSKDGWSAPGNLKIGKDRPYAGASFLRLSGHPAGPALTELRKALPASKDLSRFELATFRYRLNRPLPGSFEFFLEDDSGNRSVWTQRVFKSGPFNFWFSGIATRLQERESRGCVSVSR